ncbi:MAG: Abi family protein [Clostridiaceae bacterium]|nr:Abi family protein [Clostridiaceae bacterium]
MNRLVFKKPPLSLAGQVGLLESRGMIISDRSTAEEALLRLNYYRFSGYALHFEIFKDRQRTHQFKPGTTFDAVLQLYEFDTRLRALLFRYLEPVEVAFRGAICFELSTMYNAPHWYLDRTMYEPRFDYDRFEEECRREVQRSDEIFITSYLAKYRQPNLPPSWMISEIISLGRWSKIYSHLRDKAAQKRIASHFLTKPYFLVSWMHCLSVLRNLCAHHCRIWNRNFTIRPSLPKKLKQLTQGNERLGALVIVLTHLLKPLRKNLPFQQDWKALLTEFPEVPSGEMGMPSSTQGENPK